MQKSGNIRGYLLGVVAAASYGMNPAFAVPLYSEGFDPMSVIFWRYVLSVPAVWLLLKMRGGAVDVGGRRNVLGVVGLGILMVVSSITLFVSYTFMDVGIASSLLFVYPLLVALIMMTCYHEPFSVVTILCLLGAGVGVWLLCATGAEGSFSMTGFLYVVGSALSYAIYLVGLSRKPFNTIPVLSISFWVVLAGALALGLFVLCRGSLVCPTTPWTWYNCAMLALLPTILSFLCTNAAIERIGSTPTAALGAFEPVTAVMFGVLMFHEVLGLAQITGLVMVIVCVTLVILRRQRG